MQQMRSSVTKENRDARTERPTFGLYQWYTMVIIWAMITYNILNSGWFTDQHPYTIPPSYVESSVDWDDDVCELFIGLPFSLQYDGSARPHARRAHTI
jgi:hypothetical protein